MKKVYIVKRGDVIHLVSSNIKSCYKCLVARSPEMDVSYMRSYTQVTRIFQTKDFFNVPSNSGPKWEVLKFPVLTHFML